MANALDNFNETADTPLSQHVSDTGEAWSKGEFPANFEMFAGGSGSVNGQSVFMNSATGGVVAASYTNSWVPPSNYISVEVKVKKDNDFGTVGVLSSISGAASDSKYMFRFALASGIFQLYKESNAGFNLLGSVAGTIANGDVLTLGDDRSAAGQVTLTGYKNGVAIPACTVTDTSPLPTGFTGMYLDNDGSAGTTGQNARIAEFAAKNLGVVAVVAVLPANAALTQGQSQQYTATGFTGGAVAWSATGGTIDQTGNYLAWESGNFTITATGVSNPSETKSVPVTVITAPADQNGYTLEQMATAFLDAEVETGLTVRQILSEVRAGNAGVSAVTDAETEGLKHATFFKSDGVTPAFSNDFDPLAGVRTSSTSGE